MKAFLSLLSVLYFSCGVNAQSLFDCARKGDSLCLEALLLKDPDQINKPSETGFTPLILAVYYDHEQASKWLLRHSADPNIVSPEGSALHAAIYRRNLSMCKVLLASGIRPDLSTPEGISPLMFAAQNGFVEAIELLLLSGADKSLKSVYGYTAADYAANRGDKEMESKLR